MLKTLPAESVNCCITSPPYYGLRDYGVDGQIGLDETPEQYVDRLVSVFREVRRVLRDDGTFWLNIGDSYAANRTYQVTPTKWKNLDFGKSNASKVPDGCKPKDLIGIPWMLAFALRADGWYLRSEIIWHKPNVMPESVKDRPTKAHEQVFLLTKSGRYFYDADAIKEPSVDAHRGSSPAVSNGLRNKRSVWSIATRPRPFAEAHFAVFPPELPKTCMLAGCPESGVVLDPFSGAATTGIVAVQHGRKYIGIELNPEYIELSNRRFKAEIEPEESTVGPDANLTGASLKSLFDEGDPAT